MKYTKEQRLLLTEKVRINKLAKQILREEKKKQNKSMSKLACEAIINQYKKV
jgi:hypothetical protein